MHALQHDPLRFGGLGGGAARGDDSGDSSSHYGESAGQFVLRGSQDGQAVDLASAGRRRCCSVCRSGRLEWPVRCFGVLQRGFVRRLLGFALHARFFGVAHVRCLGHCERRCGRPE